MKRKLTGLSLPLCIRDIIYGIVKEEEVKVILSNTLARNDEEWQSVIKNYQTFSWREYPEKAAEICLRLLNQGKIKQPRLSGGGYQDLSNGHWR